MLLSPKPTGFFFAPCFHVALPIHHLRLSLPQLIAQPLLHAVDGGVKIVFPGLGKEIGTRYRQMDFHPILLFGRSAVVVPKHHMGAEDPAFKVVQMGKFILNIHVDPVGQREMARRNMNVHDS